VLNNMGGIAHARSKWEESSELFRRGLELADRIGDRSLGALMKYNLAEILIDRGLLDDAEPLIREVIRLWKAAGAEADTAEANRELARLLARRGEFDQARTLLDATRAYQVQEGIAAEVLKTDMRRAELMLLEGRPADALEIVASAERSAASTEGGGVLETSLLRLRGSALVQLGWLAPANEALADALRRARNDGDRLEEALSLDAIQVAESRQGDLRAEDQQERAAAFHELAITAAPPFARGIAQPA